MISGVQGLKIKPLAELKNDGIQKHTSIKSFSTVLSSQKKKAENTSASKAAKESAKSDSSNADTTVNKSSDSDSTAGKILYKNASTGETYVYVDVADDKTSKTNKTSDTNTADAMKKTKYDSIFKKAAKKYGVSESLLKAVAKAESNFNPNDVSSAGAIGVMQLMPSTAKELGVTTVALLGKTGGECLKLADYSYVVPSSESARIQEVHLFIEHLICELVEEDYVSKK